MAAPTYITRITDGHGRELTEAEAFPVFVPPFKVVQYFASDSYYFEVVDSKDQKLTDYDSEPAANWMRDYMNAGGDRGGHLQKYCQDCSGTGRNFGSTCTTCGGEGMLP